MNNKKPNCTLLIRTIVVLLLGTVSTSTFAEQTYEIIFNTALTNSWPGSDGLAGTADDSVSANNSTMNNSLPNANGSYSYNAFDFGSGATDPLLPSGMNAVTFLKGTVSVDEVVAAGGGGALFAGWTVTGTEPFAGHGDYSAKATATNSGSYDSTTGFFTQNFDFTATLVSGTAIATNFELSGAAHVVNSADYATGTGNTYVDNVLIPLAQERGALGFVYVDGSGVVPASSGGTGGSFPSMPVQMVFVAFEENPDPRTGLWYAGEAESGWGVTLTEQVDVIFATIFTYDVSGLPMWYVASNCAISGNGCSGRLYSVSGGAPLTSEWMGTDDAVDVGSISFAFSDNNTATMNFTIDGVSGSKSIVRQQWRSLTPGSPMTALWYAGESESGWGVTLVRQADVGFATLFTYDNSGLPTWYVASNCAISGSGCTGVLYSVTGGSALTETWVGPVSVVPAGSITFDFSDSDNGTIDFEITDLTGDRVLVRQIWRIGASFSEVQAIFTARCTVCHGTSGGMNLQAGESFANIKGVPSMGMGAMNRIEPNDLANSYVIVKLEGTEVHPSTGAIPSSELQIIKNWILDGAHP